MPFDATAIAFRPVTETIGLVPVPLDVLEHHKSEYEASFRSKRKNRPFLDVAHWKEIPTSTFKAGRVDMYDWLAAAGQGPSFYDESAAAPQEVKDIVTNTETLMREAGIETERVVGVFYNDPYICLDYTENNEPKRVCLAIWDKGKVLHIAKLYR